MGAAVLKQQFESVLGRQLDWQSKPLPETAQTGIAEIDSVTGGLPRGCLTEIYGPASSGRTSLLISILAEATARQEICALVDAGDVFDPISAASAGVRLDRLIWVRAAKSAEQALKSADLLIQGGGFGVVAMDLGDTPPASARRISLTSWFRLRRAVEHTPTVLVTVARQSNAGTCASLVLECVRERADWSGAPGSSRLLRGLVGHALAAPRRGR
jgi:replicative DNA helicase